MLIYHVRRDDGLVRVLPLVPEISGAARWGQTGYVRPTLHSAADPRGAHTYALPGGLRVRLLAESFRPYRATIRVELDAQAGTTGA